MLRFAGYAALFNRIDKGGDIIRPGAFGSLMAGQNLPLLWQHDPHRRIGNVYYAMEDKRGLRIMGNLSNRTQTGRLAIDMLIAETVSGLSFGYRVRKFYGVKPRTLLDLDVVEISLVHLPMQPAAKVHSIDSYAH